MVSERFVVKKGALFVVPFAAAFVAVMVCMFYYNLENTSYYVVGLIGIVGLFIWFAFGSFYQLQEECVFIKYGFFQKKIKYADILSAQNVKTAVSKKALRLTTNKGSVDIWVASNDEFVLQLRQRLEVETSK